MYRPDEKDIDSLSREAAEHYRAPGTPAWDALQQVLDKELPQKEEKKRRGFFFFFFLLMGLSLAGSGIWYGIYLNKNKPAPLSTGDGSHKNENATVKTATKSKAPIITAAEAGQSAENSSNEKSITAAPAVPPQKNNAPDAAGGSADGKLANKPVENSRLPAEKKTAGPGNTSRSPIGTTLVNTPTTAQNNTTKDVAVIKNKRSINIAVPRKNNATIRPAGRPFAVGRKQPVAKDAAPGKIAADEDYTGTGIPLTTNAEPVRHGKKVAAPLTKPADDAASTITGALASNNNNTVDSTTIAGEKYTSNEQPLAVLTDSTANNNRVANAIPLPAATKAAEKNDSAKTAVRKKAAANNYKSINIGLVAGMDLSTVKYTHGDNAGYNFGVMAGYQFSGRWAVYTGIVYTKKNYELNGSDYHPPKHYWTQYVKLQTVEGWCRMWEVPLLARYTFNPGSKTAFFASTGVSSYFMKKQQYNYSYKNNMNQQMTAAWDTDSSFNHVLSILHFSAGFEKKLGRHMNWQIEPYAKIPLGGVGFGNIRLSSFGVNFSVQYRQRLRR